MQIAEVLFVFHIGLRKYGLDVDLEGRRILGLGGAVARSTANLDENSEAIA